MCVCDFVNFTHKDFRTTPLMEINHSWWCLLMTSRHFSAETHTLISTSSFKIFAFLFTSTENKTQPQTCTLSLFVAIRSEVCVSMCIYGSTSLLDEKRTDFLSLGLSGPPAWTLSGVEGWAEDPAENICDGRSQQSLHWQLLSTADVTPPVCVKERERALRALKVHDPEKT